MLMKWAAFIAVLATLLTAGGASAAGPHPWSGEHDDHNGMWCSSDFEVSLDPDVSFGPVGKLRVAREPTTVYARQAGREIRYLDAGDRVRVVGCEDHGRGWCQIVKPTASFVWGADFAR
jgi:hypothetical protein